VGVLADSAEQPGGGISPEEVRRLWPAMKLGQIAYGCQP